MQSIPLLAHIVNACADDYESRLDILRMIAARETPPDDEALESALHEGMERGLLAAFVYDQQLSKFVPTVPDRRTSWEAGGFWEDEYFLITDAGRAYVDAFPDALW
ncbi:hypothetical protein BH09SUM1_BH09SUM1_25320 [soil metagenome]